MIDQFLFKINEAILTATYFSYAAAFIWGVCSVIFSPCHLASIPLIIGYIGGFTEDKKIKNAFGYSLLFVSGLFISISLIGIITSLIGRMMGDVGNIWNYIIAGILLIVALHLFEIFSITIPGLHYIQTKKKGCIGAFLLGATYGIVSGPCTFGFIAPMFAMITLQKDIMRGILLILFFALGHCIPILIGGSMTPFVKNILESAKLQKSGVIFKRVAAIIFITVALYILFK